MKAANANRIRHGHIQQFSKLGPLEQLRRVLNAGYLLRSLMSKEARNWADRIRNGAKKPKFNSRKTNNLS